MQLVTLVLSLSLSLSSFDDERAIDRDRVTWKLPMLIICCGAYLLMLLQREFIGESPRQPFRLIIGETGQV